MLSLKHISNQLRKILKLDKQVYIISRLEWYTRISELYSFLSMQLPWDYHYVNRDDFFRWADANGSIVPSIAVESLPEDLKSISDIIYCEKLLEYYLTLSLKKLNEDNIVVDIGSGKSRFLEYISHNIGCQCISVDPCLKGEPNIAAIDFQPVLISEASLPLCDLICLHCSFEMFNPKEMNSVILKAGNALRPGGLLIIAPLYLSEFDTIYYDSSKSVNQQYLKQLVAYNPRPIAVREFWNLDWCEFMSLSRLNDLNKNADGLKFKLLRINCNVIHPKLWLNYVGVWKKI